MHPIKSNAGSIDSHCENFESHRVGFFCLLSILFIFNSAMAANQTFISDPAPRNLFLMWTPDQWAYMVHHPELMQREYDRLNRLNASSMQNATINELRLMRDFEKDMQKVGVFAEFPMSAYEEDGSNIIAQRFTTSLRSFNCYRYSLNELMNGYVKSNSPAKFDTSDIGELREKYLYPIIDGIQDEFLQSRALAGYHVAHESWGVRKHFTLEQDQLTISLTQDIINRIRERDKVRPIMIVHNHDAMIKANANLDTTFSLGLLSEKRLNGWTVYNTFNYPLHTRPSSGKYAENPEYHYSYYSYGNGQFYFRVMESIIDPGRDLSLRIKNYARISKGDGLPAPEWWYTIQTQRLEIDTIQGSATGLNLTRIRPTAAQIHMQAYVALASGAKGISIWPYLSTRPKKHREHVTGLISSDWVSEDDSKGSGSTERIENFRKPYSKLENYPDPVHPEEFWTDNIKRYPFDDVAHLFSQLEGLLPEIRRLDWHWTIISSDSAGTWQDPYLATRKHNHSDFIQQMKAGDKFGGNKLVNLRKRFSLRGFSPRENISSYYYQNATPANNFRIGTLAVGMFSNSLEPNSEYYLVVNMRCNKLESNNPVRWTRAEPNNVQLHFQTDSSSPEVSQIWAGGGDGVFAGESSLFKKSVKRDGKNLAVPLYLQPGDAILLKITPE
ncbi:hypothetical protein K8I28_10690 [bacterium]|nr:hypothetical protein [bacterium]